MHQDSKFHSGELSVQAKAGETTKGGRNASLITDTILAGVDSFIQMQFMVVMASLDKRGAVWSSVLYARPGFAHAENRNAIVIEIHTTDRDATDPFWNNVNSNPKVGMLFIDLGSRRRYRINGNIQTMNDQVLVIAIEEAYPNCPRYIQQRQLRNIEHGNARKPVVSGITITEALATIIKEADTIFVASSNVKTGADSSHRGGNHGFIQIIDERTLRIPDYNGNSLFNTLGNFEINPRAGICIPAFSRQQLLQLSGRARILWNQEDPNQATGGTHRFWELEIDEWILRTTSQRLDWEYVEASPYNPT